MIESVITVLQVLLAIASLVVIIGCMALGVVFSGMLAALRQTTLNGKPMVIAF